MAHPSDDSADTPQVTRPHRASRGFLMLGVVGACALGVGAGLWARPVSEDQRAILAAAKPMPAKAARQGLTIILDDSPSRFGQPIEVLPAAVDQLQQPIAPPVYLQPAPEPQIMAPTRPPSGLVRVQAVEPIQEAAPVPAAQRPVAEPEPRLAEIRVEPVEKPVIRKTEKAKLEAKADKAKAEKPKLVKARIEKREPKAKDRRVTEQAKAAKIQLAKARAEEKRVLAEAKERAGPLARFRHAIARIAPRHGAEAQNVEVATIRPHKKSGKAVHGGGPLRMASNSRCLSSDPGAAIVCADPGLATADRRMSQAYRDAENAGVSAAQLKRQQQRWLAARSAAAREAPWAVHDVYLSRIAELNDQAQNARGGGY